MNGSTYINNGDGTFTDRSVHPLQNENDAYGLKASPAQIPRDSKSAAKKPKKKEHRLSLPGFRQAPQPEETKPTTNNVNNLLK